MKIENKKLSEIKPYEKNPRTNDLAVESVANSIKEFGFKIPIVVDKNNVIVAGHTRYKASIQLGLEEVPTIVADDLTDKQIKAFRIADNKTAEQAVWNSELLGEELSELIDDFDMTDFGFGDFELTALTEDLTPEEYDPEEISGYENESGFLAKRRVIITYDDDRAEDVRKLLGVEEINKVVYDIEDIV